MNWGIGIIGIIGYLTIGILIMFLMEKIWGGTHYCPSNSAGGGTYYNSIDDSILVGIIWTFIVVVAIIMSPVIIPYLLFMFIYKMVK